MPPKTSTQSSPRVSSTGSPLEIERPRLAKAARKSVSLPMTCVRPSRRSTICSGKIPLPRNTTRKSTIHTPSCMSLRRSRTPRVTFVFRVVPPLRGWARLRSQLRYAVSIGTDLRSLVARDVPIYIRTGRRICGQPGHGIMKRKIGIRLTRSGEISIINKSFGVWRSLVSRLVRDQEASGSNPDTPTKKALESVDCTDFSAFFLPFCMGKMWDKVYCPMSDPYGESLGKYRAELDGSSTPYFVPLARDMNPLSSRQQQAMIKIARIDVTIRFKFNILQVNQL
ncbi:hypothetical protein KL86CLO1_11951 [uncultured Eubacteriales bacterium]|uniref:Uncharacterized protein n=1 Tax=uncultured Eubacteriales bacterium TaxID=172733 RepID=A0A212JZD1_9FIRM|nr:hypothetical protein KL86CLO1_11951 [uncultured Eubacteriales bacterium]